jgi:hypothetical protein
MPSEALDRFKRCWAFACKSMWVELCALRHLESTMRSNYSLLPPKSAITDWIYAPDCAGRIGDPRDIVLGSLPAFEGAVSTLRVVLLSAAFEEYFESFLESYLLARTKYSAKGVLLPLGSHVRGQVLSARGLKSRVEQFCSSTGARPGSLVPYLATLNDVYLMRCTMAHDAGLISASTAAAVKCVSLRAGDSLTILASTLVEVLAPPCVALATKLDSRI